MKQPSVIIELLEVNVVDQAIDRGAEGASGQEDSPRRMASPKKLDPQLARLKLGCRADSKCRPADIPDHLNMSQIEEEERMSEEVAASRNSRKFSRTTQNRSENISAPVSREKSFSRKKPSRDSPTQAPDLQGQESEHAARLRIDLDCPGSLKESSTKLEEQSELPPSHSSIGKLPQALPEEPPRGKQAGPKPNKQIMKQLSKLPGRLISKKTNQTSSEINLLKKSIVCTFSKQKNPNFTKLAPGEKALLQSRQAIGTEKKDLEGPMGCLSEVAPISTASFVENIKNSAVSKKQEEPRPKSPELPSERASEKLLKRASHKPQAGSHRRTNSDVQHFASGAPLSNPAIKSARVPEESKDLQRPGPSNPDKKSQAPGVVPPPMIRPSASSNRKAKPAAFAPRGTPEQTALQIVRLKEENSCLRQQNDSYRKVGFE